MGCERRKINARERLVNMLECGLMQHRNLDLILEQKKDIRGQSGKIQIKPVV